MNPATMSITQPVEAGHSLWQDAWARLRKNRLALASAFIVAALALICCTAPFLPALGRTLHVSGLTHAYDEQDLALGAAPPTAKHWLGTDHLGRDQFTRLLYGGRVSLMVGLCATGVALTIGVLYGAIAGFLGGKLDAVMMRFVDILYALPFTLFVILLTVWLGRELWLLFAAIGAVEWLTMARIVRGQVASLKRMEFVEAAHALGLRKRRIILRHMIPNVLGPVIVYTTLTVPAVMLLEAFLSFLGLGVQPPMSSWGSMIKDGADRMEEFWWMLVFPAGAFSVTLFCLNFLGDGLRDALDVRASKD
jgi:oligopeptide transport system permease protein